MTRIFIVDHLTPSIYPAAAEILTELITFQAMLSSYFGDSLCFGLSTYIARSTAANTAHIVEMSTE